MADDQDEPGTGGAEPDLRLDAAMTADAGFLPPLEIAIDAPGLRYAKLSRIVAELVVPRLVARHAPDAAPSHERAAEIVELARLALDSDDAAAAEFVLRLKDRGFSLDTLHTELLEPAARHLGERWSDDTVDFLDVTLAVSRLQRLVHVFEGLDQVPDYDEKRKVLLVTAPGEQHSLGSTIVHKFLRAGGWHVWTCGTAGVTDAAAIAAREWFAVIGFSISSDLQFDWLRQAATAARSRSLNPRAGIMVGGSAIERHPDWVAAVGADGSAANGPAAVILAKKLLAASLL